MEVKPWVVVDPSIILASGASGFEYSKDCERFITQAGFAYHPFITKPLMGELLNAIKELEPELAATAFRFVHELLQKFRFIPHMHLNDNDLSILKNKFTFIRFDDVLHIAHVCEANRSWVSRQEGNRSFLRFATIDGNITDEMTIRQLQARLNLTVINPVKAPF